MTILLKLNPSTQPVERARSSAPNLLRRVAWPGSGRIFPLPYEAIAVEARSFACAPDSAELTSATSIRWIS